MRAGAKTITDPFTHNQMHMFKLEPHNEYTQRSRSCWESTRVCSRGTGGPPLPQ